MAIQDQLIVKLHEYDLGHIATTLIENGFISVRRVVKMQPRDVVALALSRGDEVEFEEMRQALEQEQKRKEKQHIC